jgi:lipopolysaccharide export system protein LptC
MNRLRLLASVIFFSAMGMMWFSLNDSAPVQTQSSSVSARQPDYVAIDLTRVVYDASGRKTQSLSAKKMTYFDAQDQAEFESPLLILESAQNNGKWRISATSGMLFDNQRLLLEKNVNAVNLDEAAHIDRITGEHIRVNIIDNVMLSDHAVNLYGDGIHISGSSLIANLDDQNIELLQHAKTIYQISKQP